MTRELAEAVLRLNYSESLQARLTALAEKSNRGTTTPAERRELEEFVSVGDLLAELKSKARHWLRHHPPIS